MQKYKSIFQKYFDSSPQIKATMWFVICSFLQRGVTVVVTPIFTRILTTAEYGRYTVYESWLEIITIIVSMRLSSGVFMRGLVKEEQRRKEFTSELLALSILLTVGWGGILALLHSHISSATGLSSNLIFLICPSIMVTIGAGFWSVLKRVQYDYKPLIIITIVITILKPLTSIIVILLMSGDRVFNRAFSEVIISAVFYIPLTIMMLKEGGSYCNLNTWRYALLFNMPLIPHYLSQIILNHSDRIMISRLIGDAEAGIYSLAYSMAMLMVIFNTSIHNTLSPWTYEQLKNRKPNNIRRIDHMSIAVIGIINYLVILVAPEAIRFFAPPTYWAAIDVVPPVALGVYYMFVYGLFVTVEMFFGKNYYVMISSVIGALLNVVLNFCFIPRYGFIAAGYTTLASYIVYACLHGAFSTLILRKNRMNSCYNLYFIVGFSALITIVGLLTATLYKSYLARYGIILLIGVLCCMNMKKLNALEERIIHIHNGDNT